MSGVSEEWYLDELYFVSILQQVQYATYCKPGRGIQRGEDLHSKEGRGGEEGNHTKEVVSGGKRANLTRSCRAITLLVSTNTDDGNSTFQCSPVDTCSDGNSLPGSSIATGKVGWHVASNVASGGE